MTPDNKQYYSLLCETSYSDFKPVDGQRIVDDTNQGLVNAGLTALMMALIVTTIANCVRSWVVTLRAPRARDSFA